MAKKKISWNEYFVEQFNAALKEKGFKPLSKKKKPSKKSESKEAEE